MLGFTLACENVEPTPEEQADVEALLLGYLEALAQAYSDLDASRLEPFAAPQEIQSVQKVLNQLAQAGDRVEATLLNLEVERLDIFRRVNATVRLTEVWDVARFDAFTGEEKVRNPQSVQTSMIQLRLTDAGWRVTARRVLETATESRWAVTPKAGQDQ
jgi:hypothetical protein